MMFLTQTFSSLLLNVSEDNSKVNISNEMLCKSIRNNLSEEKLISVEITNSHLEGDQEKLVSCDERILKQSIQAGTIIPGDNDFPSLTSNRHSNDMSEKHTSTIPTLLPMIDHLRLQKLY